jgi:hypothetical protein
VPSLQETTKQERGDSESNAAKETDKSRAVSSPQLSGRRRRKLAPAGEAAVPGRRRRHAGAGTEGPGGDGDGHFCHRLAPWRINKRKDPKERARMEIKSGPGRRRGVRLCYKGEGADGIMTMISMAVAAALSIG